MKRPKVVFDAGAFQMCHDLPREAFEKGRNLLTELVCSEPPYRLQSSQWKPLIKKHEGKPVYELKWHHLKAQFRAEYVVEYDEPGNTIFIIWVGFRRDANGSH